MTIQELFNDARDKGLLQVSAKEGDFVKMLNNPEHLRAFYDYVGERNSNYFNKDYNQFQQNIANGLREYQRQMEQAQQASAPAVQAPKVDNNQSFLSNLGNAMLQGGGAMSSGDAAALQITNEADKVRKEEQQARAEREAAKTATIPMSAEDKIREDEIRLLESVPHHKNQTRIDELKAQRPSYLQDAKSLDDIYRNYVEGWMANTPEGQQGKKQLDSDFENVVSTLQQQFRESKTYKDIVAKYKEQLKNTDASDEAKVQAIYGDIEKELNDAWQKENGDILNQEYRSMVNQLAEKAVKGDKGYIKYQQEKFMEGAVQDAIQSGTDEVSQLYKKYNNQTTVNQNPAGIFGPYATPNMNGNSDAVTNLFAAGELYRQALIRMKDTKKGEYKFGSFMADFARNALNTLPNLATMGVSDLAASKRQADVLKKIAEANAYDNPESVLDESEMALYNAIAANTAAEIARSENTGWGASAAKLSADMLPFVRDIMVGQGLIGGLTEAGKKGIIRGIARTIGNGKWAKVLANVGVTGTGMAESAAIAGFTPSTYALAFDNTAKIDAQGLSFDDSKIKIGKIDTQSYGEGLAEAYDTQIRELFTETGGNTQLMLRALKDTPFIKAFGRTKLGDFNRIFANSTFGQFLNKAAYHGIVGELSEEWENTFYDACKAAIDGGGWEAFKQTYGDFVSPDTQVPMLISFSIPALLGGAASMRQMRSLNNKYSKAYSDLKNTLAQCGVNENDIEDVVNDFRGSLYAGAIEDMPQAISSIANAYSNGNEDNFQRLNAALSQYAVADAQLGAMQADQSSERSVVKEQYRQAIKEGHFQGESDDTYDPITNKTNGYIYHARQAGDEQSDLHIIDGNVVTTTGADGKLIIDKVSSDEKLTVVDAEGHVTLVSPDELELIEAPVAAYEAKAAYMERANQINEIKPGDSVVVNGESSIIKGKTDEGIVIDVMGTDGQAVEQTIPFETVLRDMTLIKSEDQKPVVITNGSTIRVQALDNGDGTYSVTTQDGITTILTPEQMTSLNLSVESQQASEAEQPQSQSQEQFVQGVVDEDVKDAIERFRNSIDKQKEAYERVAELSNVISPENNEKIASARAEHDKSLNEAYSANDNLRKVLEKYSNDELKSMADNAESNGDTFARDAFLGVISYRDRLSKEKQIQSEPSDSDELPAPNSVEEMSDEVVSIEDPRYIEAEEKLTKIIGGEAMDKLQQDFRNEYVAKTIAEQKKKVDDIIAKGEGSVEGGDMVYDWKAYRFTLYKNANTNKYHLTIDEKNDSKQGPIYPVDLESKDIEQLRQPMYDTIDRQAKLGTVELPYSYLQEQLKKAESEMKEMWKTSNVEEQLAAAESEVNTEPTEAQKEAGNFKKGHFSFQGFDISIENPKGSVRRGVDADGNAWERKMQHTYGYLRRTKDVDGEPIDVFIGENLNSNNVFVVDQLFTKDNPDLGKKKGDFDEHKVMIGFDDIAAAKKAYLSAYEKGWQGLGNITEVSMEDFKKWIDSSNRKTKPFSEYKSVNAVQPNATIALETDEMLYDLSDSDKKIVDDDIKNGNKFGYSYISVGQGSSITGVPLPGMKHRKEYHSLTQSTIRKIKKSMYDYAIAKGAKGMSDSEVRDVELLKELEELQATFAYNYPGKEVNEGFVKSLEDKYNAASEGLGKDRIKEFLDKAKRLIEIEKADSNQSIQRRLLQYDEDFFSGATEERKQKPVTNRKEIEDEIKRLAVKLDVTIGAYDDIKQIRNASVLDALKRGVDVDAWYERSDGSVNFYLPNVKDADTVRKNVMHEVIAHKGLRQLLGKEQHREVMLKIWNSMTDADKNTYGDYVLQSISSSNLGRLFPDIKTRAFDKLTDAQKKAFLGNDEIKTWAADEFVAYTAENLDDMLESDKIDQTMWEKICDFIREAVEKVIGAIKLTNDDIRNLLLASRDYLLNEAKVRSANENKTISQVAKEAAAKQGTLKENEKIGEPIINAVRESYEEYAKKKYNSYSYLAVLPNYKKLENKDGVISIPIELRAHGSRINADNLNAIRFAKEDGTEFTGISVAGIDNLAERRDNAIKQFNKIAGAEEALVFDNVPGIIFNDIAPAQDFVRFMSLNGDILYELAEEAKQSPVDMLDSSFGIKYGELLPLKDHTRAFVKTEKDHHKNAPFDKGYFIIPASVSERGDHKKAADKYNEKVGKEVAIPATDKNDNHVYFQDHSYAKDFYEWDKRGQRDEIQPMKTKAVDKILAAFNDAEEKYSYGLPYRVEFNLMTKLANLSDEEIASLVDRDFQGIIKKATEYKANNLKSQANVVKGVELQGDLSAAVKPYKLNMIDFADTDKNKPALTGVYHDNGNLVATDARILVVVKDDYDKSLEGKLTDKNGNVMDIEGASFPNYKGVLNSKDFETNVQTPVSAKSLRNFLAGVVEREKGRWNAAKKDGNEKRSFNKYFNEETPFVTIRLSNGSVATFNFEHLSKFADAMEAIGADAIHSVGMSTNQITAKTDKGIAILMVVIDEDSWKLEPGNGNMIDYDDRNRYVYDLMPKGKETKKAEPKTNVSSVGSVARDKQGISKESKVETTNKIDDYGEKIAGARKDMLKDLAKTFDDATIQSLIALPFGKAFKRPDVAKLVKNNVIRESDALYVEAYLNGVLSYPKPKESRSTRYDRSRGNDPIEQWAKSAKHWIEELKKFIESDEKNRDAIIDSIDRETDYQNPIAFVSQVLNRLGYQAGDKVELDYNHIAPGHTRFFVDTPTNKYNPSLTGNTQEDAINNLVTALRYQRGELGLDLPTRWFGYVPGKQDRVKTGKFNVMLTKPNTYFFKEHTYNTEEEAKAAEEKFKNLGYQTRVEPHTKYGDPYDYRIYLKDPLTGDELYYDKLYPSESAVKEAFEKERNEISAYILEKNAKNRGEDVSVNINNHAVVNHVFEWDKEAGNVSGYAVILPYPEDYPERVSPIFKTRDEAQVYYKEHHQEIEDRYQSIRSFVMQNDFFKANKPRVGEDYRNGKNVTEKDLADTFGFRGIQFGNWTNNDDRQLAVNEAYDALLDLCHITGLSPRAISLNGELGIAFGARGSGNANAHYESDNIVINLTKTRGAGSLAHEWLHALDNYFARQNNIPHGFVSSGKLNIPDMREELKDAWDDLMDDIRTSNYGRRSKDRGEYWGSPWEEAARLFAEWVNDSLEAEGKSNHFLSRGIEPGEFDRYRKFNYMLYKRSLEGKIDYRTGKPKEPMSYEEFIKTPDALKHMPYPTKEETAAFAPKLRKLFDTIEEKVDEDTKKVALFHVGDELVRVPKDANMNVLSRVAADAYEEQIDRRETDAEEPVEFHIVTDKKKLDWLDKQETVKVYRAMDMRKGELYAPMSDKGVGGSRSEERVRLENPQMGKWEEADENYALATMDEKKGYATITIDADGVGTKEVAYNPYIHTSRSMLNDQFTAAWRRNGLQTVETEVPVSELTSGYKAYMAKNATGETEWKAGPVGRLFPKGKERKVILTRWAKPVRVVPMEEYAADVKAQLLDAGIDAVPFNCVTPDQRDALIAAGIKILPPIKSAGDECMQAYRRWLLDGPDGDDGGTRFHISEDTDKYNEKTLQDRDVLLEYLEDSQTIAELVYRMNKADEMGYGMSYFTGNHSMKNYLEEHIDDFIGDPNYYDAQSAIIKFDSLKREYYELWGARFDDPSDDFYNNFKENMIYEYRKSKKDDVRFHISTQMDTDYKQAVQDGDMKKAQEIVRDAAAVVMPNTKFVDKDGKPSIWYRGDDYLEDNGYKQGEFYSQSKIFAKGYGKVRPYIINSVNPFDGSKEAESLRDFVKSNWEDIKSEFDYFFEDEDGYESVEDVIEAIKNKYWVAFEESNLIRDEIERRGYDSIIINEEDNDNLWLIGATAKSAEPVTYDNDGNIIPLSKRFDTSSDDIRFHISSANNERFNEELGRWESGEMPANEVLNVGTPTGVMKKFLPNLPIMLRQSVLTKATKKHNLTANDLQNLPSALSEPIFVFKRTEDTIGVLTELKNKEGKNVCVAIELSKEQQSGGKKYNVNDITTLHEREVENILRPIVENETLRYVDKEKGLEYLSSVKSNLQEIDNQLLNSAAKVIQNFDITKSFSEKSQNFSKNNENSGIRFHIANQNNAIFVSNAEKAVREIKQDKATPQQWLAMIEKSGGMKAGEDKWLGLSEWLNTSAAKTITKQDILDYIAKNRINIEEVQYAEFSDEFDESLQKYKDEFAEYLQEGEKAAANEPEDFDPVQYALDRMTDKYGDDFNLAFELDWDSPETTIAPSLDYKGDLSDAARHFLDGYTKVINNTRLEYTTEDLENKREIALTVPTIEPWNENDDVHFGDAGQGRAIAWIRFGETTAAPDNKEYQDYRHQLFDKYNVTNDADLSDKISDEELEELERLYEPSKTQKEQRVLVIDEIQSKRHQEGREKGYSNAEEILKPFGINVINDPYNPKVFDKDGNRLTRNPDMVGVKEGNHKFVLATEEEWQAVMDYASAKHTGIPAAPFEKNWMELAFKRMIRYAAENGYDRIAWTTGEQQADRYDIGQIIDYVTVDDWQKYPNWKYQDKLKHVVLNQKGGGEMDFLIDKDGKVWGSDTTIIKDGSILGEVVGKELATKIMEGGAHEFDQDDLRIGAEGMAGFYDRMLPEFVKKYTKKWGATVEDVELPKIGETMHSVNVTPEMKESALQGQVMFRIEKPVDSDVAKDREVADFLNLSTELDEIDKVAGQVKGEFATYRDMLNEAFIAEALRKRKLRDEVKDDVAKMAAEATAMDAEVDVISSFSKQYSRITEAMKGQHEFDSALVYDMANFVRYLNQIGWLDNANRKEMSAILKTIAKSSSDGKAYLSQHADELMNLVTTITARRMRDHFENRLALESKRAQRKNISGVETQGSLGIRGQRMIKTLAEIASKHQTKAADLEPLIEQEIRASFTAKSQNAADEHLGMADGYIFAKHYIETIQNLQKQEGDIQSALNDLKLDKSLRPEAKRDLHHTLNLSMMNNHIKQMKAYGQLQDEVLADLEGGRTMAKEWAQQDAMHKQDIRSMADDDLKNLAGEIHKRQSPFKYARMVADAFTSPTRTFESMLRMLGMDSIDGEGKLFDHFIRKQVQASEKEYLGLQEAYKTLDGKATEIMGKPTTWREMAQELGSKPGAVVSFFDVEQTPEHTPKMVAYELTQGNLAYIYAVHKMEDGQMKLNAMGVTDADVYNIVTSALDPTVKAVTDWLQMDFLKDLRKKYNEVHMRLFGAPMDEIRNYFPLRIAKGATKQEDKLEDDQVGNINMAGTSTGTIKVRTVNTKPLDLLNADVFSIPIQHVQEMEHWAAFSELTRDANVLFSYPNFQNKVKNMRTFFGEENDLYKYLRDTFRVAMGTYRPNTDPVSRAMMSAARGVTAAKISGRSFTAIKQLASHPAFWSYMADEGFTRHYLDNCIHPIDTYRWGAENMPLLKKRINSRDLGDFVLAQRKSDNELLKAIQQFMAKYGMAANVFIDSLTCATGAKAVYDTRYVKYSKQGLPEEEARRKALDDAEIAYNRSQQSTEGSFVSAVQRDRTWQTVAMSTYRNSNMAYTRNMVMAARNLKNMTGEKNVLVTDADGTEHMEKRSAKDILIENAQRRYEDQGMPTDEAKRAAEDDYNRSKRKNIADLLINAYLMNLVWRLFGYMPYLLTGDDDEKKKALIINALSGGMYLAPLTGFIGGQILESVADGHSDLDEFFRPSMAIASDAKEMYRKLSGDRFAEAANDAINLIVQMGTGFDPKTLEEVVVAICMNHNNEGMTDALLDVGAILAIPKSQRKQIFLDQLDKEFDQYNSFDIFKNSPYYKAMLKRYVDYQLVESAPATFWARTNETEEKAIERLTQQFNNLCKERFELRGKK